MFEENYLKTTKKIKSDEKTQNEEAKEENMNLTASVATMRTVRAKTRMIIEKQNQNMAEKTEKSIK